MLKAILLDLDNTLYDEYTFVRSGFKAVSKAMAEKCSLSEEDLYRSLWKFFLKVERKQVFSETLHHFNIYDAAMIPEMVTVFRNHDPVISVFSDVHRALVALKEKFALGLVTDGKKWVQEKKVKALKLHRYFDVITYAEDYGGKCCPKPFIVTLEKLKVDAEDSLFVDDNPLKGFAVAKELGLRTVRMLRGENVSLRVDDKRCEPDFEIESYRQLFGIVRRLEKL